MVDGAAVSRIGRSLAVALVVGAVLVAGVGPGVGADSATDDTADGGDRATLGADEVEADRTVLTIRVRENGTAAWTIEYFLALETREDEQAWDDLQNDVETNTSDYLDRFSGRIDATVDTAENETRRTMSATDYGVETRTQPQFGVVEYSFAWQGFAVADGDEIRAGDAIDGFLLDQDTRMVMQWPEAYTATTVEPAADTDRDNAAVWRGSETEFVTGEPRVVVSAAADATTQPADPGTTEPGDPGTTEPGAGTTAGGTDAGTGTPGGTDEGGSDLPFALVVGLLGMLAVGALVWYGYQQREKTPEGAGSGDGGDGGVPSDSGDGGAPSDGGDGSAPSDGGEATASEGTAGAAGATAAQGDDGVTDEELLSNEERVLKLVRENGGRMKQQEVVDELDWTEAKTSQVVRGLRDEDELEGFRLGRENVLKLPGENDEI